MENSTAELIPTQRIAYIRHTGAYGPENRKTMECLKQWAREKGLFHDSAVIYAIAWDNPMTTMPEKCRYDVCIKLDDSFVVDGNVSEGTFEQGWYAVFTIAHTAEAIQQAWQTAFQKTQDAGYQIDEIRVVVERYRKQLVDNHLCELCVPIKK